MPQRRLYGIAGLLGFLALVSLVLFGVLGILDRSPAPRPPSEREITTTIVTALLPTVTPIPRPTSARPTPRPTATSIVYDYLQGSRGSIYQRLDDLGVGFLPLNTFPGPYVATKTPNGDIRVEIFGKPFQLEAVEVWFRLTGDMTLAATAIRVALEETMPGKWEEGFEWVRKTLPTLADTPKSQKEVSDAWLTLQYVESMETIFFSVDKEKP